MEVIEREVTIPEHTTIVRRYIASNGQEFAYESDCLRYEERLRIENHPVFKSKIPNIRTFEDDYSGALYYLSNEDDHEWLMDHIIGGDVNSDFDLHGPGWYLYYYIDGGDHSDIQRLLFYDAYEKAIETRFAKWKSDIRNKMAFEQQTTL